MAIYNEKVDGQTLGTIMALTEEKWKTL